MHLNLKLYTSELRGNLGVTARRNQKKKMAGHGISLLLETS
jgi:hypothetical protein